MISQSLLSHATILPGTENEGKERYVDAEAKRSFAFDHVTLVRAIFECRAEGLRFCVSELS